MLNSVEHEILNAHKYKNIKKFGRFLGSVKPRMLFFLLIHVKMPTIVGILTFMSGENFRLNLVEHEKSFITSGPENHQIYDHENYYTNMRLYIASCKFVTVKSHVYF